MADRLLPVLRASTWILAGMVAAVVVVTWLRRVAYPYDLEWMEGGMVAHAWWLLQGNSLYGPPSPEFVPYIYPPGYAALVAALGQVGGLSLPLARWVSIVASALAAALLVRSLRSLGASWRVAAGCAAVWLATWPASGTFMDLARPDALGMALVSAAVAAVLHGGPRWAVGAGGLIAVAFVVKHNLALFALPLGVAIAWRDGWRLGAVFALAAVLPASLCVGALQIRSDGHLWTYLVTVPLSHPAEGNVDRMMWAPRELATPLPVAFGGLAVGALVLSMRRVPEVPRWALSFAPVMVGMAAGWAGTYSGGFGSSAQAYRVPAGVGLFAMGALPVTGVVWAGALARRRQGVVGGPSSRWVLLAGLLLVAVGLAIQMRGHIGGFRNVYMPAHWVVVLAFGAWLAHLEEQPDRRWVVLAPALLCLQLVWAAGLIEPGRWVPTAADRAVNDRLVEMLRTQEGPVLSPFAAWLPTHAGHPPSLHYMGLWDLEYPSGPYVDARGPVFDAVASRRWPTVLAGTRPFPYQLLDHYRVVKPLYGKDEDTAGMPVTGYPVRPERLLVPR